MREIHVVIISLHADPFEAPGVAGGGGTHSYLRELIRSLPLRDIGVSVVTRRSSAELPSHRALSACVDIYRVDIGPLGPLDKRDLPRYHDESLARVGEVLARIAHPRPVLHGVYWNSGRVAAALARERGLPMAHTVISLGARRIRQGEPMDVPIRLVEERSVFTAADAIIAVSAQERRDLIEFYNVESKKIVVVGRPIDDAFVSPAHDALGQPKSPLVDSPKPVEVGSHPLTGGDRHWWWNRSFTYVGRMLPQKGVPQIIQAWLRVLRQAKECCPPLWLVGGTPPEVESLRRHIGLTDLLIRAEQEHRLRWWGYLEPHGISALLLGSAALLMHSRYEPGGRVVIEAMAAGVPVIATPHGFAWDLVEDWREGFIVDFDDVSLLADRLLHFVRQPLLSRSLGEASRQTLSEALSQWRFLDTHVTIYQSLSESRLEPLPAPASIGRGPSFLSTRRAWSYYPLQTTPPDSSRLAKLFPKTPERPLQKQETVDCHEWTEGVWTVRWLHHLVLDRPIWDPTNTKLVYEAHERIAAIRAASETGCFVPVRGVDLDAELVLVEQGAPADPLDSEVGLHELIALFECLEGSSVALPSPARMRMTKVLEQLSEWPSDRDPLLGAGEDRLLAELRPIADGPDVLSWDPTLPGPALRCRTVGEKLLLDGGCRLCAGTAGRPVALVLLELLERPHSLQALLDRVAPLPDRVIAWAWLTLLESAMKGAVMHRSDILAEARRRARLLSTFASGSPFILSS